MNCYTDRNRSTKVGDSDLLMMMQEVPRTLCSRLVMLFRMSFIIDCSSFAGPVIRVSISSSSGPIKERISSMAVSYLLTLRIVCAASGCFPMTSSSLARG